MNSIRTQKLRGHRVYIYQHEYIGIGRKRKKREGMPCSVRPSEHTHTSPSQLGGRKLHKWATKRSMLETNRENLSSWASTGILPVKDENSLSIYSTISFPLSLCRFPSQTLWKSSRNLRDISINFDKRINVTFGHRWGRKPVFFLSSCRLRSTNICTTRRCAIGPPRVNQNTKNKRWITNQLKFSCQSQGFSVTLPLFIFFLCGQTWRDSQEKFTKILN